MREHALVVALILSMVVAGGCSGESDGSEAQSTTSSSGTTSSGTGAAAGSGGSVGGGGYGGAVGGAGGSAGGGGGGGGAVLSPNPGALIGKMPDSAHQYCFDLVSGIHPITCPTSGPSFGQDGTYLINVPTYTATNDTVSDSVTGLMWQKTPMSSQSWSEAVASCDGLSLEGHSDWRLPSLVELVSIYDYGSGGPATDLSAFTNWQAPFWSATEAGPGEHWLVYFQGVGGTLDGGDSFQAPARCVRGASAAGNLFEATADTVIDHGTGLEWTRSIVGSGSAFAAIGMCENLTLDGNIDWRLPNAKEIFTVINMAYASPVVDPSFFNWPGTGHLWVSTFLRDHPYYTDPWGFQVSLADGISHGVPNPNASHHLVCVRGG